MIELHQLLLEHVNSFFTLLGKGCILDDERTRLYASMVYKGSAERSAFAAAIFGEFSEVLFWLQLPHALSHFVDKSANRTRETSKSSQISEAESVSMLNRITSRERSVSTKRKKDSVVSNILMLISSLLSFCVYLSLHLILFLTC